MFVKDKCIFFSVQWIYHHWYVSKIFGPCYSKYFNWTLRLTQVNLPQTRFRKDLIFVGDLEIDQNNISTMRVSIIVEQGFSSFKANSVWCESMNILFCWKQRMFVSLSLKSARHSNPSRVVHEDVTCLIENVEDRTNQLKQIVHWKANHVNM